MMELVVITGAISRAELESNHRHQQTTPLAGREGTSSATPQ